MGSNSNCKQGTRFLKSVQCSYIIRHAIRCIKCIIFIDFPSFSLLFFLPFDRPLRSLLAESPASVPFALLTPKSCRWMLGPSEGDPRPLSHCVVILPLFVDPGKLTFWTQKLEVDGKRFSFSIGWFLGHTLQDGYYRYVQLPSRISAASRTFPWDW